MHHSSPLVLKLGFSEDSFLVSTSKWELGAGEDNIHFWDWIYYHFAWWESKKTFENQKGGAFYCLSLTSDWLYFFPPLIVGFKG